LRGVAETFQQGSAFQERLNFPRELADQKIRLG
jgi:hypothetical protein